MISVSFQPLKQERVGILRIHDNGGSYLDKSPYEWAATCHIIDEEAYLYGATKPVRPSQWRAIRNFMESIGVQRVHWRRETQLARDVDKHV